MNTEIIARRFELAEDPRIYIETRLQRLETYGLKLNDAVCALEWERNRFIAELTLFGKRVSFHAETTADEVTVAWDSVVEKVEKQIQRYKQRWEDRSRRPHDGEFDEAAAMPLPSVQPSAAVAVSDDETVVIPMPDRFAPKPMSVDEAAMQLNLSKNSFMVFRNAGSHEVNVLFKKRNGAIGWIHP